MPLTTAVGLRTRRALQRQARVDRQGARRGSRRDVVPPPRRIFVVVAARGHTERPVRAAADAGRGCSIETQDGSLLGETEHRSLRDRTPRSPGASAVWSQPCSAADSAGEPASTLSSTSRDRAHAVSGEAAQARVAEAVDRVAAEHRAAVADRRRTRRSRRRGRCPSRRRRGSRRRTALRRLVGQQRLGRGLRGRTSCGSGRGTRARRRGSRRGGSVGVVTRMRRWTAAGRAPSRNAWSATAAGPNSSMPRRRGGDGLEDPRRAGAGCRRRTGTRRRRSRRPPRARPGEVALRRVDAALVDDLDALRARRPAATWSAIPPPSISRSAEQREPAHALGPSCSRRAPTPGRGRAATMRPNVRSPDG